VCYVSRVEMLDQFRGCLLGLACGDALGGPLEFLDAEEIRRRHGHVHEMLGGGWLNLRPGQVTDDTEQMLCLLESYVECAGFDPQDIADRLLEWYRAGPLDVGNLTREACENLLYGYHFERAGRDAWESVPEGSRLGNGSLMRAAPTGLLRYHDNIHLIGESRVISGITHYDERCKLACSVFNLAIAHLMLVGTGGLIDELLDFAEPRNTVIGYALRAIPGLQPRDLRSSGYVLDTLQTALWTALYTDDIEEGLTLLVNLGGDTDTIGAVGGALLGARFGVQAIPPRWLRQLEQRERIDAGAQALYRLSQE
jgi:ADP-ribosyl-[dinitrogen reductase] hydrolase